MFLKQISRRGRRERRVPEQHVDKNAGIRDVIAITLSPGPIFVLADPPASDFGTSALICRDAETKTPPRGRGRCMRCCEQLSEGLHDTASPATPTPIRESDQP